MKRIGIMGGTFNPIHMGHINIALAAYKQYELDKVLFIPSGNPPHKRGLKIASDEDRYNMVCLAAAPYPFFEVSRIEIDRVGYSYTYETLNELKELYKQSELYFIIGADSLFYLEDWKKPQSILKSAVILVANREESDDLKLNEHIKFVTNLYGGRILIIDVPKINISSTEIRTGTFDEKLVPSDVIRYINTHDLYLEDNDGKRKLE